MAMLWQPQYTITDTLLRTIRQIGEAIGEINTYNFTNATLAKLQLQARQLSAYASTSIEGNPLPLTDVKQLLKTNRGKLRDTEQEVLNYNNALQGLYDAVGNKTVSVNTDTLAVIQGQVVSGLMDNPADCGSLRQAPVVIRNPQSLEDIVFIPPDAKDVPALLNRLFSFVDANLHTIDPVILAGIFHRQCVIIHPFMDGNGRSTRLMTTAILGVAGLNLFKIFSFENYYNQNITKYFQRVGLVGDYYDLEEEIDHTKWLEYFAEGILDELSRVRKLLPTIAAPRLEPHHQHVLNYLNDYGSITQREYEGITTRSLAARKLDFEKLLTLGYLEKHGTGRGTYYKRKL